MTQFSDLSFEILVDLTIFKLHADITDAILQSRKEINWELE